MPGDQASCGVHFFQQPIPLARVPVGQELVSLSESEHACPAKLLF